MGLIIILRRVIVINLKKENLINCFENAKKEKANFIAALVEIPGNPLPELIINPTENFGGKLEYYKETYDENLIHKFADKDIKIAGFTRADTFGEIKKMVLTK